MQPIDGGFLKDNLGFEELHSLLESVFGLKSKEASLTLMVDLPNSHLRDNSAWSDRRRVAEEWFSTLSARSSELSFDTILLCTYENVGTNNNDLPHQICVAQSEGKCPYFPGEEVSLEKILKASSVVIAPTELSATAPLKNLAKSLGFRGATMPGFTRQMIPSLLLDYEKVNARVMSLKSRLDRAVGSVIELVADGTTYSLFVDLRYRSAHASGGLMREDGTVANLPSGEAYIVPYEGERAGDLSRTNGVLPVQFGDEIVLHRIEGNRATSVLSSGEQSDQERSRLQREPAYGNIAELGLGVLGEWGVRAMGSILLDEKLGLHIAFGRSEHFGGVTGPAAFMKPENVIHIDRVYVPSCQPRINPLRVSLSYEGGEIELIMENGEYRI